MDDFRKNPKADDDGNYPQPVVIGTDKNLSYKIGQSPSTYVIVNEIKNKSNNSEFITSFDFKVEVVSGMMVLHVNAQGQGDYSAIRSTEMFPSY